MILRPTLRAKVVSILALCLLLAAALAPARGAAHALDPGFLDISTFAGDTYRVVWRQPDVQGKPMAIVLHLPEACETAVPPKLNFDGRAWIATWVTGCDGGLRGRTINVEGLENTQTDVLVRYELGDGVARTARLTAHETSLKIPENPGAVNVLATYLPLGVEHILGGVDHLLFVLALLLLIPDRWRLLSAITAFTVAHSLTMAAATLGVVTLPGPPVEAVIALSIMFVASELVRRDGSGSRLSERAPWLVSFAFGLLHGFGFAGALVEIGLPPTDVPLALLSFNLGVEVGQLAFVAVVLTALWLLHHARPSVARLLEPGTAGNIVAAYAIGGLSAYWVIDRIAGF